MPYWLATRHWYTPDSGTSNSWITTRDLPDPPLLVTSFSDASSTAMPSWIIFPFQYHRWIGFGTPLKRHSTARSDAGGMAWGPLPLPTLLSSESTQGRAAWRKHGHYWNLKLKCTLCTCENYRDSLPELHWSLYTNIRTCTSAAVVLLLYIPCTCIKKYSVMLTAKPTHVNRWVECTYIYMYASDDHTGNTFESWPEVWLCTCTCSSGVTERVVNYM